MEQILIGFVVASAIVVVAGVYLTRWGDELGERLNLGGTWVGIVVLSAITSLPELVSSIGSAAWQGQPDLACGNIFGSNCFNVFIIALLDFFYRNGPISLQFGVLPAFSAGLGILMTALGGAAILVANLVPETAIPDGVWSALIVVAYVGAMYLVFRFERREFAQKRVAAGEDEPVEAEIVGENPLRNLLQKIAMAGFCVVLAGLWMVDLADALASYEFSFGTLGHTFVGSLGLALATSLPELVVGVTAVRMGKLDMAVGNVFGSNLFNILILAVCHVTAAPFHEGSFYASIGLSNLLAAFLAMALAGVAVAGLVYRSERTFFRFGWDTLIIFVLFISGMYLIFLTGSS